MAARAEQSDTLRGRTVPAFSVSPESLVVITDRKNAQFRESALEPFREELVGSIIRFGIAQALIVRRDGDRLEVIDGRKRVAAAMEANRRLRALGQPEVKCIVTLRSGTDHEVLMSSVTVNANRYQDSVLELAVLCRRIIDLGGTLTDCATACGRSIDTIENWMKLDDLHPEVRAMVRAGTLKYTVAMRLARLPRARQLGKLKLILRAGATNANAVRAVVDGRLERVTPPDKHAQRRVADELLKAKAFAVGDQESDCFSFAEWLLGRISGEELLGCLRSGVVANAVKTVIGPARVRR
jgi:ParB family chromosome partitioning protein